MKIVKLIFTLMTILACKMVTAHALWIETDPSGTKNNTHEIKIYYGEYSQGLIEPFDKWYSDVNDFKIYIISPTQQKTEISKVALADSYTATFTPTENGTHIIYIDHYAKEPYKTTAFEFLAMAKVHVGNNSLTQVDLALAIDLDYNNYKVGDLVTAKVTRNAKVFTNAEIEIVLPDGWAKKIKTDDEGIISFKIPVKGKYLLEVTDTENKNTNWFGTTIDKIWRANTVVLFVN